MNGCECHLGATFLSLYRFEISMWMKPIHDAIKAIKIAFNFQSAKPTKTEIRFILAAISVDDGATILCTFVCCN